MNPDGSNVRLCNCSELWESSFNQEGYSPDKKSNLYVRAVGARGADMQIWVHNNETNSDSVLTGNAPYFPTVDYDAAWSPDGRYIAWVSEVDGNDEIYLYDIQQLETKRLTTNSFEWDKRPSFSPDSARIVFWSNRDTSRKQIWVMNRDGNEPINLSQNEYNDWDPLWVK
jgi:TolB protein